MLIVKCISNNGEIYRLTNRHGEVLDVHKSKFKKALASGKVICTNFKLTSDNRLIRVSEHINIDVLSQNNDCLITNDNFGKILSFVGSVNAINRIKELTSSEIMDMSSMPLYPESGSSYNYRISVNFSQLCDANTLISKCKIFSLPIFRLGTKLFVMVNNFDNESASITIFSDSKIILSNDKPLLKGVEKRLGSIDFCNVDTTRITNLERYFASVRIGGTLDLSTCDFSRVSNINGMFEGADIDTIIFPSIQMPKVESFDDMFNQASIKQIDFNGQRFGVIKSLYCAFCRLQTCYTRGGRGQLDMLDISNISIAENADMTLAFSKLNVKELKIPNIKTTKLSETFGGANIGNLNEVISHIDTSECTYLLNTFYRINCNTLNLSTLDLSNVRLLNSTFEGSNIGSIIFNKINPDVKLIDAFYLCGADDANSYSYYSNKNHSEKLLLTDFHKCKTELKGLDSVLIRYFNSSNTYRAIDYSYYDDPTKVNYGKPSGLIVMNRYGKVEQCKFSDAIKASNIFNLQVVNGKPVLKQKYTVINKYVNHAITKIINSKLRGYDSELASKCFSAVRSSLMLFVSFSRVNNLPNPVSSYKDNIYISISELNSNKDIRVGIKYIAGEQTAKVVIYTTREVVIPTNIDSEDSKDKVARYAFPTVLDLDTLNLSNTLDIYYPLDTNELFGNFLGIKFSNIEELSSKIIYASKYIIINSNNIDEIAKFISSISLRYNIGAGCPIKLYSPDTNPNTYDIRHILNTESIAVVLNNKTILNAVKQSLSKYATWLTD